MSERATNVRRRRGLPAPLAKYLDSRSRRTHLRLLLPSMLTGVVAGVAAAVFFLAIRVVEHFALGEIVGYHVPPPHGEPALSWLPPPDAPLRPWLFLVVPTIGGLLCGLLVNWLAPEAEGHGTNNVIESYHHRQGAMRPLVPLVKIVASALTLGTGGSGGREGPIAQIGAGFGSFFANVTGRSPTERRILLAAGMGGGISAIFRAPLAGAIFAAEVLYRSAEFESSVIVPSGIAAVVAYGVFGVLFSFEPLFAAPDFGFSRPVELIPMFALAVWLAFLAAVYTRVFYGVERTFRRMPVSKSFRPAIGVFLAGALALVLYALTAEDELVFGVMGAGYGVLQQALLPGQKVALATLLLVAAGKIVTTSLTIASGGSGGVFGPSVVIGGCAGGALGLAVHRVAPALVPEPGAYVIIGAAGFFAAAAKTPFSSMIIVAELTGDYRLLVPALWVCMLAYWLSDDQTIYDAQLESRSRSPANADVYVPKPLRRATVGEVLKGTDEAAILRTSDSLMRAIELLRGSPYVVLPVIEAEKRLVGIVTLEDVYHEASPWLEGGRPPGEAPPRSSRKAGDFARQDVRPLLPTDTLEDAVERFVEHDLFVLPVVDSDEDRRLVGVLRRYDVDKAYLRLLAAKAREGAS